MEQLSIFQKEISTELTAKRRAAAHSQYKEKK